MIGLGDPLPPLATDLLLRSTVLVCAAWLAVRALRRAKAAAASRHLIWLSAVAGLLLLPLLAALLPEVPIPLLSPASRSDVTGAVAAPAVDESSWGWLLSVPYVAGATILLLRLACARWMLRRLWDEADVPDASWPELVEDCRRVIGVRRQVGLRLTRQALMPMTWGMLAPKVLLPVEASAWTAQRRRLVLMHELGHVARHDALTQSAASIACVLYWFHPLVWFAARQMRREQEQAADDLVLSLVGRPVAYARCLVELAQMVGGNTPALHAAAVGEPSQLESRISAILRGGESGGRRRPTAALGSIALLATWLVSTVVPVEATEPVPPATPEGSADAVSTILPTERPQESLRSPAAAQVRSYTAIGSAPPEAAGPSARPDRAPRHLGSTFATVKTSSSPHARPGRARAAAETGPSIPVAGRAIRAPSRNGPAALVIGGAAPGDALVPRSREGESTGALSPSGVPRPPAFAPGSHRPPLAASP